MKMPHSKYELSVRVWINLVCIICKIIKKNYLMWPLRDRYTLKRLELSKQ